MHDQYTALFHNHIYVLNQLHQMKIKLRGNSIADALLKNISRIEANFETNLLPNVLAAQPAGGGQGIQEWSVTAEDPIGQPYDDRCTDCDAEVLAGTAASPTILETIQPVIRLRIDGSVSILQRGIVVVGSPNSETQTCRE